MKNKYIIGLLGVVVLLQIVANGIGLCYNVDSIYDEGFLYYCQQSALKGGVGGMSQNTNIIAALLGSTGCGTILGLRMARFGMTLLSALLFIGLTANAVVKGWRGWLGYGIVCLLMVVPVLDGIVLSYNGLAQFFDCLALACGYLVLTKESKWNYLWCVVMGGLLTFGLFSILPSAVLLMGCLFILLLIRYWKTPKYIGLYALSTIAGMLGGLTLFHFAVVDLRTVFAAMSETATTVTTLNRGYDPISFVLKILLFLRDWFLMAMVVVGSIAYTKRLGNRFCQWLGGLALVAILLVYAHYQQKPMVTVAMLMSSMWIGVLWGDGKNKSWRDWVNFDQLLNLFLAFAPLILSIGTNTYLGGKMAHFMLPWALLLYRLGWHRRTDVSTIAIGCFVAIVLSVGVLDLPKMISGQKTVVDHGPLAGMHLTDKQAEHFAMCDSIMRAYGYAEQESVVFTTQLGTMTNCYMNAKSYANYFQPMDFVANPKEGSSAPDFLFLCQYDEDIAGDKMRQMGWGWPENFDKYEVGSPENYVPDYPTDRKLYCRKK